MTPCLNEETLQAYFDGELASGATAQVIKHLAECDGCAASAFEVERAIELMASAFEDELPDSAPSDRLRARIAAALAGDSVSPDRGSARRFWPHILGAPVAGLKLWTLSPRRLAFASLGILALVCALWLGVRSNFFYPEGPKQAQNDKVEPPTPAPAPGDQREPNVIGQSSPPGDRIEKRQPGAQRAAAPPSGLRQSPSRKRYASSKKEPRLEPFTNDRELAGSGGDSLPTDAGVFDAGMVRHFEQAQMLLRSFRNSDTSARGFASELDHERRQSKSLLYRNILLRRDAESSGNLPAEEVLGSLEPVLLDIANLPDHPSADDVRSIKERIHKKEIIGVLQVYSAPSMVAGYQPY